MRRKQEGRRRKVEEEEGGEEGEENTLEGHTRIGVLDDAVGRRSIAVLVGPQQPILRTLSVGGGALVRPGWASERDTFRNPAHVGVAQTL